jgi:hypothetical protein
MLLFLKIFKGAFTVTTVHNLHKQNIVKMKINAKLAWTGLWSTTTRVKSKKIFS